jgi:hypothetical protein
VDLEDRHTPFPYKDSCAVEYDRAASIQIYRPSDMARDGL